MSPKRHPHRSGVSIDIGAYRVKGFVIGCDMPVRDPFILDFFQNHLPFTPTPSQIALFESDLAVVSPYIMQAALKEVAAGRALLNHPFSEWREAIFEVYHRKVAEHAQLFPVFHTFETAFRSLVAVELAGLYRTATWWMPVHSVLRAGGRARTLKRIGVVDPVPSDTAHLIGQIIFAIEGERLQRPVLATLTSGYEFAELCDLSHISQLISEHWSTFGPKFVRGTIKLSKSDFSAKFRRVREARNDVYHHKSVASMTAVVDAAEDLLDYINISLDFFATRIQKASLAPLSFLLPVELRHNAW